MSRASRVAAKDVLRQVNDALAQMIGAGGAQIKRGRTEVLLWMGAAYQPARAASLKASIAAPLQKAG